MRGRAYIPGIPSLTSATYYSPPKCPDGAPHHRICGPLIEQAIPDYYDTHERPAHGCEEQVCCHCLDRLVVRLWWAADDRIAERMVDGGGVGSEAA